MIDLERQIRDYYDRIIIPVTADDHPRLVSGPSGRIPRSRALVLAAAFVVVLVGVGVTVLVSGGEGSPIVDRSMTTPTTTGIDHSTPTTTAVASIPAGWEQVAAEEPWVESIVGMEAIPGDGFVIRAADPWGVYWSPDGVEWLDADPTGQIDVHQSSAADSLRTGAQVIAANSDRVVVLDRLNTGLWVGEPQTGVWEQIIFDTTDKVGGVELLAVESNGTEFLVVAATNGLETVEDNTVDPGDGSSPLPRIDQYIVWLFDSNTRTVEPHPLPVSAHTGWVDDTVVEWFDGHWVIYLAIRGRTEGESLLVSPDGVEWTMTAAPQDWGMSLTSLTAGSTTMVATVCNFGGDSFWFSEDGMTWEKSTSGPGHHSTYSDELGFVVIYESVRVSEDGRAWRTVGVPNDQLSGVVFLEASGDKLLVGDGLRIDETPMLWLWVSQ